MKKLRKIGWYSLIVAVVCIAFAATIFWCTIIPEKVLAPEGTKVWTVGNGYKFIFLIELFIISVVPIVMNGVLKSKEETVAYRFIKKHRVGMIFGLLLVTYVICSDTSYVLENQIVCRNPLNPWGTTYELEDIAGVDTGFYGYRQMFGHQQGDFYYYVRFKDGSRIDLNSIGGIVEDDMGDTTYQHIQALDEKLVARGVGKIASTENSEKAMLEATYLEQMLTIINNK